MDNKTVEYVNLIMACSGAVVKKTIEYAQQEIDSIADNCDIEIPQAVKNQFLIFVLNHISNVSTMQESVTCVADREIASESINRIADRLKGKS